MTKSGSRQEKKKTEPSREAAEAKDWSRQGSNLRSSAIHHMVVGHLTRAPVCQTEDLSRSLDHVGRN